MVNNNSRPHPFGHSEREESHSHPRPYFIDYNGPTQILTSSGYEFNRYNPYNRYPLPNQYAHPTGQPYPQTEYAAQNTFIQQRVAPQAIPAGSTEAGFVKFAADNPDTEASKLLGLQDNTLDPSQKNEVMRLVGQAAATTPGNGGFFSAIGDFFKTVMDYFMNNPDHKGFGELLAEHRHERDVAGSEKTSMEVATKTYQNLASHGYEDIASKVSGVEPDGKGGFQKIQNEHGQAMGIYAFEEQKICNPGELRHSVDVDRGLTPSPEQLSRMGEIFNTEIAKLYSDPEVRGRVEQYRENLAQHPGKNEEVKQFLADNHDFIQNLSKEIAADPAIRQGGKYDFSAHQDVVLKQVEAHIKASHKEAFEHYSGAANVNMQQYVAAANVVAPTMPSNDHKGDVPPPAPAAAKPPAQSTEQSHS